MRSSGRLLRLAGGRSVSRRRAEAFRLCFGKNCCCKMRRAIKSSRKRPAVCYRAALDFVLYLLSVFSSVSLKDAAFFFKKRICSELPASVNKG